MELNKSSSLLCIFILLVFGFAPSFEQLCDYFSSDDVRKVLGEQSHTEDTVQAEVLICKQEAGSISGTVTRHQAG